MDEFEKYLDEVSKNINLSTAAEHYAKQFEGEFTAKPNDVLWLCKENHPHASLMKVKHFKCDKEINVLYLVRYIKYLHEQLRDTMCPNCNQRGGWDYS